MMGIALVAALGICFLYALFGKTDQERTPLLAISVGFGTVIGFITVMGYIKGTRGWDVTLFSVLLFVGTLNAVYGTLDIYDDTVKRAPAAGEPAQLVPSEVAPNSARLASALRDRHRRALGRLPVCAARWLREPEVHGAIWFMLASAAFCLAIYW